MTSAPEATIPARAATRSGADRAARARIALVAGESSSDLIAAQALGALHEQVQPMPELAGIAGPRMIEAGVESWWPSELLAVNGYAAVLRRLPQLLMLRRAVIDRARRWPADLFLGIDAPDFNLGVEAALRATGMKTMHFVSPSIWAWRRERIETIRRAVDRILLVFPFEKAIYDGAGIDSAYVGHPLADRIPMEPDRDGARLTLGLVTDGAPTRRTVIAVLPGSRKSEIELIAPVFIDTAGLLARRHRDAIFVIPAAGAERFAQLQALLRRRHVDADVRLVDGRSHEALAACDATLIASGTATLEAALYKRPMVIAYRIATLSYHLMKDRGYLPYVGLPNILAGEFIVPEYLQHAATPLALADAIDRQLDDTAGAERLRERFAQMHRSLACGCAQRFATEVASMLDRR